MRGMVHFPREGRPGNPGDLDEPAAIDGLPQAIAHPCRRCVLSCLADRERLSLAVLATEVASIMSETPIAVLDEVVVTEVAAVLYHRDLPLLADAALVELDPPRELVSLGQAGDQAAPILDLVAGRTSEKS